MPVPIFVYFFSYRTGVITMTLLAMAACVLSIIVGVMEMTGGIKKLPEEYGVISMSLLMYCIVTLGTNVAILYAIICESQYILERAIIYEWVFIAYTLILGLVGFIMSPYVSVMRPTNALKALFITLAEFGTNVQEHDVYLLVLARI